MAELSGVPTDVTLMRFNITPNQLLDEYDIWTLEFPIPFQDAIWQFKIAVESRLKSKGKGDHVGIPTRQLNNAFMSIFPALVHGFEIKKLDLNDRPVYSQSVAIVAASAPLELPEPGNIQHVIREWAQLWTGQKYVVENIPEDERLTLRSRLVTAINKPMESWKWKRVSANQLLSSFNPNESLNYDALPSLFAALLHGKVSNIHGKQIQWRKVQDSDSERLSIVGFVNQRPIKADYSIHEWKMDKSGEGYFAYKLDFRLQTQAGRSSPWMFVSVHAQRYAHEALTHANDRRRVSILTAANRARLDDFNADLTLIKFRARDISKDDSEPSFQWDDNLAELISRINATPLQSPNDILDAPQNYWRASRFVTETLKDEYYIIHAEGYKYGDDKDGHQLEAGFSMTDSAEVFENIVSEHLPMLQFDTPLVADDLPTPSGKKKPLALHDYTVWATSPSLKPKTWGTLEQREAEQHERYLVQRSQYQKIVRETIARAVRGKDILIAVLWTNEATRDGICKALEEAFLLNPGDDYPANVQIINRFFNQPLVESLNKTGLPYEKARRQRMIEWRKFLKQELPPHPKRLAIVEMLGKGNSWGVKGAVREACAREGIASQMVETIRMKLDDAGNKSYLGGPGNHEHRANSVAHEIALRHIGALYGNPQEIYQVAGINEQNLEVLAFFIRSTKTNIKYPLAVKLAHDGAFEVLLPGRKHWLLYRDAAPILGQIFAGEWLNTIFRGKRKIDKNRKSMSELWYEKDKLSNFVLDVLKTLGHPTIALIEAENWRNFDVWPQLGNLKLHKKPNSLDFSPNGRSYERNDPLFTNLLAVIRIRADDETPQYLTDTHQEFTRLSGFVDTSTGNLLHYFSIGRQLVTSRGQRLPSTRHATMFDLGAGVAYKYPQVVEFVPFFVRDDYADLEGLKKLCRVSHYLRISPAWPQGNIVLPYPMHLARQLVEDQLCILDMDS